MIGYLVRRIGQLIPVLVLAAIAVWALVYALPGDPSAVLAGGNATPDQIEEIRQRLGLDQPVWVQFFTWIGHAFTGDLGQSAISKVPVGQLLGKAIPATLQLALLALIIMIVIAIPLGMVVALKPRSWGARIIRVYLSVSLATPPFWVGLLLIIVFSVALHALPAASQFIPIWQDPLGALRMTILPAFALGAYSGGVVARFVATSLTEAMQEDYVRTVRSKGVSERNVIFGHALRNSLIPTLTVGALQLGSLLGGAVVMEVLFSYPGVGRLLFNAIDQRDFSVLQATVLFVVLVYLVLNLIVDILYARLDPRIRLR